MTWFTGVGPGGHQFRRIQAGSQAQLPLSTWQRRKPGPVETVYDAALVFADRWAKREYGPSGFCASAIPMGDGVFRCHVRRAPAVGIGWKLGRSVYIAVQETT